jgi:hypothetical protein
MVIEFFNCMQIKLVIFNKFRKIITIITHGISILMFCDPTPLFFIPKLKIFILYLTWTLYLCVLICTPITTKIEILFCLFYSKIWLTLVPSSYRSRSFNFFRQKVSPIFIESATNQCIVYI